MHHIESHIYSTIVSLEGEKDWFTDELSHMNSVFVLKQPKVLGLVVRATNESHAAKAFILHESLYSSHSELKIHIRCRLHSV